MLYKIEDIKNKIICGDCLEELKKFPDNSIDTIITDPPYALGFMGKEWDTFDKSQFGRKGQEGENDLKVKKNFKILPRYGNWSGYYEFSYQWAKEALRVAKPGATLLCFGGCYDDKTEVLTEEGWKFFRDVSKEDRIATLNPETEEIEYQNPIELVEYDNYQELIYFKTNKVDLMVTPNHKLFVKYMGGYKNAMWKLVRADKVKSAIKMKKNGVWKGKEEEFFVLPATTQSNGHYIKEIPEKKIPMDIWLKFFGLWLAEGSATIVQLKDGKSYKTQLCHFNNDNLDELEKELSKYFNICRYKKEGKFVINDKQLTEYLQQFGYAWQKFIPGEIKQLSSRQLKILLDWYMKGDSDGRRIYTSSKKLVDDIQEIALKIGISADYVIRKKNRKSYIENREIRCKHIQYVISINRIQNEPEVYQGRKKNKIKKIVPYKGKVYCVEVPKYHTLYVRRNGKPVWCGNTRTWYRLACAIEDAGWIIKDTLMWVYGCLSEDTEILTINGWEHYHKNIDKYPVLCYNVNNDKFEFHKPIRKFLYENEYPAYRIKSNFTDQIVSRNHRVLVEREGKFIFQRAEALQSEENIPILESLQDLPETIYDFQSHTSIKKSDLLKRVSQNSNTKKQEEETITRKKGKKVKMSDLWQRILASFGLVEKEQKSLLFKKLFGKSKRLVKEDRIFRQKKLDRKEFRKLSQKNDWSKQPILEGWGNIFQKTRKLFTDKICQVSERIFGYGSERWLCYGTSAYNGTEIGQTIIKNGSGSSYQSQSSRQQNRESYIISKQQRTQTIRSTRAKIEEIEYKGNVWCVEVPTGAFVARRNGKIFITGNSGFPKATDISKQIDKKAGKEREIIGEMISPDGKPYSKRQPKSWTPQFSDYKIYNAPAPKITKPATPESKLWNGWKCISGDAKILTTDGWKGMKEIIKEDKVFSLDLQDNKIKVNGIKNIFIYDYNGKMMNFKNKHTDQLVTPNHRLLCKRYNRPSINGIRKRFFDKNWRYIEAEKIDSSQYQIPIAGIYDGKYSIGEDFAELLGWIFTEANYRRTSNGITITQSSVNKNKTERIRNLLKKLQISFTENIYERRYKGKTYLVHYFNLSAKDKKVVFIRKNFPDKRPTEILWHLPLKEKQRLYEGLILGDGYRNKECEQFSQKDKKFLEWFQVFVSLMGYTCKINEKRFRATISKKDYTGLMMYNKKEIDYQGKVWCIETELGNFIAKRNDMIFITGNSHGLKPAWEPIIMAMKPNEGSYAENALKWGVAGLNIDGGRIDTKPRLTRTRKNGEEIKANPTSFKGSGTRELQTNYDEKMKETNLGRFPANLVISCHCDYQLKSDITKEQKKKLMDWLYENA